MRSRPRGEDLPWVIVDIGIAIAITAALLSASGVVFTGLTLRQTAKKDALGAVETEMKAFKLLLDECRSEFAKAAEERDRLRAENFRLMRDLMRRKGDEC